MFYGKCNDILRKGIVMLHPNEVVTLSHEGRIKAILDIYGTELDGMIHAARLWGLHLDSPKIDKHGMFVNAETLLHVECEGATASITVAEGQFQHWAMNWMLTFDGAEHTVVAPSIWNPVMYTSRPNAYALGLGVITERLYFRYGERKQGTPSQQAAASLLLEKLGGLNPVARDNARYNANEQLIQKEPRLAAYRQVA